jgi:hypothetical protein
VTASARLTASKISCSRASSMARNYDSGNAIRILTEHAYLPVANERGVQSVAIKSAVKHNVMRGEEKEAEEKVDEAAEEEEVPSPMEDVDSEATDEQLPGKTKRGAAYRCIVPDCDIYQKQQKSMVIAHIKRRHEEWLRSNRRVARARVAGNDEAEAGEEDVEVAER